MKYSIPSDRSSWRLPKKAESLTEGTKAPALPTQLKRMSEKDRLELFNYLVALPLQELKRRHDVIHSNQSEVHQHLRRYGSNSSLETAKENLEVMDDFYRRASEIVSEQYDEVLSQKYGMKTTPAWDYHSWGLPHADPRPETMSTEGGIVTGGIEGDD
jgi:hypothetical protein